MAKKKKLNEWWRKYQTDSEQRDQKEATNPRKSELRYDEDGLLIDNETPKTHYLDEYESNYDYGFDQKFEKNSKDSWSKDWNKYEKSGEWKGYTQYRTATLSYKYVQQMANTIAAQGGVTIEIGNTWNVDIDNRKLTYNPTSLMYGTKGELLATLLHEVGKISNSTGRSKLQSTFLSIYQDPAYLALSVFEDMRIDMLMLKEFPSAGEVYESNINVVHKVAEEHVKRGETVRNLLIQQAHDMFNNVKSLMEQNMMKVHHLPNRDQIMSDYMKLITKSSFGKEIGSMDEVKKYLNDYITEQKEEPMLDEYIADMLRVSYGIDKMDPVSKCAHYTDNTSPKIQEAVKKEDTQDVISMMDSDVYPIIEKILKQPKEGTETANKFFQNGIPQQMMANVQQQVSTMDSQKGAPSQIDPKTGNMMPRLPGGGRGDQGLPKEWHQGDYPALKESVEYEIKQLVNRLNFIKRDENTIRYIGNQRRGKLDMKRLYRYATGNRRIFKKVLPKRDTIQSFAFSLYVDISGSMDGDRIINATRGLIVFAEVFNRFQIPFEIMVFDTGTKVIKSFEDEFDPSIKKKIGGIVQMANGGTTLGQALKKCNIHKQSEANRVVIVLSDGDTESHSSLDEQYFIPWEKKGIKAMGVGIETGTSIKTLCHGNSIAVDNSSKLPTVFSDMLKKLIKR